MTNKKDDSSDIPVIAKARAFHGPLQTHNFLVEHDGTVRIYDSIATHYTLHHGLSPAAEQRIRRLAGIAKSKRSR